MKTEGKKFLFLGDSITEGCGASCLERCFVSLFATAHPEATVKNYGIGGTRISKNLTPSTNSIWDRDFISRVEEMDETADVVCVFGGTNDFGHGSAELGAFGDDSPYTFYGALKILTVALLEKYPNARIAFFTPLHRADIPETAAVNAPDRKPLSDYVKAVKENAEYYSLPVLDLWAMSGMQPSVPAIAEKYFKDRLHPNDTGYERLYELVDKFIENL